MADQPLTLTDLERDALAWAFREPAVVRAIKAKDRADDDTLARLAVRLALYGHAAPMDGSEEVIGLPAWALEGVYGAPPVQELAPARKQAPAAAGAGKRGPKAVSPELRKKISDGVKRAAAKKAAEKGKPRPNLADVEAPESTGQPAEGPDAGDGLEDRDVARGRRHESRVQAQGSPLEG